MRCLLSSEKMPTPRSIKVYVCSCRSYTYTLWQRAHDDCAGKATVAHAPHSLPINRGCSLGQVNNPAAIGSAVSP